MCARKKRGFSSKLRSTISSLFSPCGKNAEENSIIREKQLDKSLDFVTTGNTSETLETLVSDHKLEKGFAGDGEKNVKIRQCSMEVDLCFVLDCTSSMERYITAAKDCILKVVNHMEQTNPNIKLWVGLCGYRDYCDGSDRLQIYDFTDSYLEFKNYISNRVMAVGGGDEPESVLGGLNAAVNKMNWSHRTRVLLHMGDSPPHGRNFTSLEDDYPDGDPNGLTAESVLKEIQSAEIHYYFGKITEETNEMLRVFRGIIGEFMVFDVATEGKDPKTLTAKVFKSICSSITTSVTLTSTMEKIRQQKKTLEKDSLEPDWNTLTVQIGELLYYHLPETLNDIKDLKYFKEKNLITRNFSYKQAPNPFSAGAERYAYFALDVTNEPVKKTVMKAYIDHGRKANSVERYLEKVEVSNVAYFLSKQFNLVAKQVGIDKKVNFLKVQLLRHTGNRNRYFTIEPKFQDAEFKRFNVNNGVIKEYHSVLEAFAHFTYEHTGGYLVVYDLQGVELTDQFLLTDPAIHCTDRLRFGRTNLGSKGIDKCLLSTHKCGSICKRLGLTEI